MVIDALIARVTRRLPDFVIGDGTEPYMSRWWLIPRNRWFNVYLHHITRDDDDRALHDHMYVNASILLRGGYYEVLPTKGATLRRVLRRAGSVVVRRPSTAHRLELAGTDCWSLFITGPRVREWGFWCPKGWVHWKDFVAADDNGRTGPGCGEG